MINRGITKYLSQLNQQNKQAASIEKDKAALSCDNKMNLKLIQVGDNVSGKLMQDELGILKLKLMNDLMLSVTIQDKVPMNMLLDFCVVANKDGILQLKQLPVEESSLKDKVIKELGLPTNEHMSECIQYFLEDERSLTKVDLLKTYHLSKKFSLPVPVIVDLADKLGIGSEKFFGNLQKAMEKPLYEHIQDVKGNLFEDSELTLSNKLNNSFMVLDKYIENEEEFILPPILKQSIAILDTYGVDIEHTKDYDLLKSYLANQINNVGQQSDDIDIEEWIKFAKEVFEGKFVVDTLSKGKEHLSSKDNGIYQSSKYLAELVDEIDTLHLSKQGKDLLQDLREPIQAWQKLNEEGHYYQYPLFLNHKKQEAEIYFFKPNKKKNLHKNNFYAVISLDFSAIDHIDVHIHQVEQLIDITIEVENDRIKQCFYQLSTELLEHLKNKGYHIQSYSCRVKSAQSRIESLYSDLIQDKGINIKV